MILAKGCRAITIQPKHLSQWRYAIGTNTRVTRKGSSQLHDSSCIIYMMVAARKQGRARGRAKGSRMKAVVTQPTRSQLIKRRHVNGSAKCARCSKTDVVKQNDHHIWRFCRRFHLETRRCFCIPGVKHC